MKKRIIMLILEFSAIAITFVTLIGLATAWFINMDRVRDIKMSILQIDSMVTLYEANDINFNGVPNRQDTEKINKYYNPEAESYVDYKDKYHDEDYSFNYLDQRYALSHDSSANLLNTIELKDVCPSKVYTFKFEITNYVGVDNTLLFGFDSDEEYSPVVESLKNFDVRLGIVDGDNKVTFSSWTNFCTLEDDTYTYNDFTLNPLENNMVVAAKTNDLQVGRLDLWLQIRENPLAEATFERLLLPQYRITLSCELSE